MTILSSDYKELNRLLSYTWFSSLKYSNRVELCEKYFNERSPDDLTPDDIVIIFNYENLPAAGSKKRRGKNEASVNKQA